MKRLNLVFIFVIFFAGCTGRVQTNPLPKQSEVVIPSRYAKAKKVGIQRSVIDEYDRYARLMLSNPNSDENSIETLDENIKVEQNYQKTVVPKQSPRLMNIWERGRNIAEQNSKVEK
jgi:lipoprotein